MDWNSKTTAKHILEAEAVGLKLFGIGNNRRTRKYSFGACGHTQDISPGHVRKNRFRCRACQEIKLVDEAERAGLMLISIAQNSNYRIYQFKTCGHQQPITLAAVRNKEFKCKYCLREKHGAEAQKKGLALVGKGKNLRYRLYKFIDCGHEQEIAVSNVRNHESLCDRCFQKKLKSEAQAVGLILLGAGKNKNYRMYQFNECGHKKEIQPSLIRKNSIECDECYQKKLEDEAKLVGLTLIGPGRNVFYRQYRFNLCGHEVEKSPGAVRDNRLRCETCLQKRLEKEAQAVGLVLLGSEKRVTYRIYRFVNCEHEQAIRLDSVRQNSFICQMCENTSRELPSKVYLLKIYAGSKIWLKLGYAKELQTRIKQYRLPEKAIVEEIKVIDFDTGREAHEYEALLHKKFISSRLLAKEMRRFHKGNGFNECYPVSIMAALKSELENKQ